jgi:hypothetical protein
LGAVLAGLELGGKALPIDLLDRIGSRGPIARDHKSRAAELAFRERAPHQLKPLLFVASEPSKNKRRDSLSGAASGPLALVAGEAWRGVESRGEVERTVKPLKPCGLTRKTMPDEA